MPQSSMVGSRIREKRVLSGMRQADLAKRAGISPSYLNLIEHNRRRIAGKTLLQLAEALEVDPNWLSEGAAITLIDGLQDAAGAYGAETGGLERAEDFAGRFPGWADLLVRLARRIEDLEETVQALTDRLAHDPHLAASLHEVISTVTAIRSTASILADTKGLEPEWRARFDRNLNEDSRRLAEGAEALVRYLENAPEQGATHRAPQDEVQAFLTQNGFRFEALESGDASQIPIILRESTTLTSQSARAMAEAHLRQYAQDAAALSMATLLPVLSEHGARPDRLFSTLGVSMGCLFRRLATLPEEISGPVGLVICDASGSLIFRKPLPGFSLPGSAGACPLWPLYQVLSQPNVPVSALIEQADHTRLRSYVQSYALAEHLSAARFDMPARIQAYMLLLPANAPKPDEIARPVGPTCRICPREACAARREISIISKGF